MKFLSNQLVNLLAVIFSSIESADDQIYCYRKFDLRVEEDPRDGSSCGLERLMDRIALVQHKIDNSDEFEVFCVLDENVIKVNLTDKSNMNTLSICKACFENLPFYKKVFDKAYEFNMDGLQRFKPVIQTLSDGSTSKELGVTVFVNGNGEGIFAMDHMWISKYIDMSNILQTYVISLWNNGVFLIPFDLFEIYSVTRKYKEKFDLIKKPIYTIKAEENAEISRSWFPTAEKYKSISSIQRTLLDDPFNIVLFDEVDDNIYKQLQEIAKSKIDEIYESSYKIQTQPLNEEQDTSGTTELSAESEVTNPSSTEKTSNLENEPKISVDQTIEEITTIEMIYPPRHNTGRKLSSHYYSISLLLLIIVVLLVVVYRFYD